VQRGESRLRELRTDFDLQPGSFEGNTYGTRMPQKGAARLGAE